MNKSRSGYKRVKWLFGKEIEIPEEWIFESLQSKINILPGFAFSSKNFDKERGFPLIRIRDLVNMDTETRYYGDFPKVFLINTGDLLVGMDGEFRPYLWKGKPGLLNQRVCKITTTDNEVLDRSFIFYAIAKPLFYYELLNIGTTVIHISKTDIEKITIPIPLIKEQQKIASILSGVDALIESTQEVIAKTERLKKGLMQKLLTKGIGHTKFKKAKVLFGKHKEIPEEWEVTEFRKISVVKRGASPRPINDPKYFGQGRGWIRIQDVSKSNKYLMQTKDYLSEVGEMKSIAVDKGDIIMSIAATVGKTIIVKMNACIHDGFIVFSNLSSKMNNEFLYYLLANIENEFKNTGQHGTQSNINSELVSKTKFFKPPLLEQQKIASILSSADAYIQKNQEYKKKIELLKKGLMQKLLTGQIRVKVDH